MIRLALLPEAAEALAAAVTYLAHSTLWAAAVWLAARPWLRLGAGARNLLWRAALVGPLLSTVLALLLSDGWRLAAVELAVFAPAVDVPAGPVVVPRPLGAPEPARPLAGWRAARPAVEAAPARAVEAAPARAVEAAPARAVEAAPARAVEAAPARAVEAAPARAVEAAPVRLVDAVALLLALVGAARLARLGLRQRRFWWRLRHRQVLTTGAARERLTALAGPFAVRLTRSPHAVSPMALGRAEICLPTRALDELEGRALAAVLAHELAHLERRDNGWLTLGAVIEAALFFQPLTRLVRRSLDASAERAADEWAVARTGDAVALARSLAIVAAWYVGNEEPVPVAPMARAGGDVLDRVRSLLDGARGPRPGGERRARLALLGIAVLALAAPAIAGPPDASAPAVKQPEKEPPRDWQPPPPPRPPAPAATSAGAPRVPAAPASPRPATPTAPRAPARSAPPMPPVPPLPPTPPMPPLPAEALTDLVESILEPFVPPGDVDEQKGPAGERRRKAEERLEREMAAWGKDFDKRVGKDFDKRFGKVFEKQMKAWGKAQEPKMKAWGDRYAAEMQAWSKRLGGDMKKWRAGADGRVRNFV